MGKYYLNELVFVLGISMLFSKSCKIAPWCGPCVKLKPIFQEACKKLSQQNSNVKCAEVDTQQCGPISSRYGVRGIPTVILFKSGNPYKTRCNERESQRIVNWALDHSGPRVKPVCTVSEARQFIRANPVAILGFFKNSKGKANNNFNTLSEHTAFEDCSFASTNENAVFDEFSATDGNIYLFRQNNKLEKYEGNMDADELVKLLYTKLSPLTILNQNTLEKIFTLPFSNHLWFFLSGFNGPSKTLIDTAIAEAQSHRNSVLFSAVDVNNPSSKNILNHFGIDETCAGEIPTMRMISKCQTCKYKPDDNEICPKSIESFIDSVIGKSRKCYKKCAKKAKDWNRRPVWCLTSDVHDEVVNEKGVLVLVKYFAPWCGPCKACAPEFEATAIKYANRTDVRLCEINLVDNEIPDQPTGYPTFRLYKRDNKRIEYKGARTVAGFSSCIDAN